MREMINDIDLENFDENSFENIKCRKTALSNREKRELKKIFTLARVEPKEQVLKAIVYFAIWDPDEAIEEARRKGIFRYKVFGMKGENCAKYYLTFFAEHMPLFEFAESTRHYLIQKRNSSWLLEFYEKTDEKIDMLMEEHQKKRIRKKIQEKNYESSLHKELLAYIDMIFFFDIKENDRRLEADYIEKFSKEEQAEGVSYLLFKYLNKYMISQNKNYIIDKIFVKSDKMAQLILLACRINYLLELELLIDFYDYEVISEGNRIIIRSKDTSFEQSVQLAYIMQKIQVNSFYIDRAGNADESDYLSQVSKLIIEEIGEKIVDKKEEGMLSRYIFSVPTILIEMVAEQKVKGKVQLYKEEGIEIDAFSKEICMTVDELYRKRITEHCNAFDVLIFQRFFRFIFHMQKLIYERETDVGIILSSLVPVIDKRKLLRLMELFLKSTEKASELFELLEYDKKYKLDLQYTPLLSIGEHVIYPVSILAESNLMRNVIAYSYLSGNKKVNDDEGLEPLVKICKACFDECEYKYNVFTNKKYKYKGKSGEIDVLVVSEDEILIIECKSPLMPTSNFEMRATFEHINKASKQLDFSKEAFEDEGFCNKYFKDSLKMNGKRRTVRTCIILGNRLFSIWSGSRHPVRYIYELNMILNSGKIYSNFATWRIWEGDTYSHADLKDFLNPEGKLVRIKREAMEKYNSTMKCNGKKLYYESYRLNVEKFYDKCDEELQLIERNDKKWNEFKKHCRISRDEDVVK